MRMNFIAIPGFNRVRVQTPTDDAITNMEAVIKASANNAVGRICWRPVERQPVFPQEGRMAFHAV